MHACHVAYIECLVSSLREQLHLLRLATLRRDVCSPEEGAEASATCDRVMKHGFQIVSSWD